MKIINLKAGLLGICIMFLFVWNNIYCQPNTEINKSQVKTKVDDLLKKYIEYGCFSMDGMNLSSGYIDKFKDLFADKAFIFNDLDTKSANPSAATDVETYVNYVRSYYYGGVLIELSNINVAEPVKNGSHYYIDVTAVKKISGFHETYGKINFSYNAVFSIAFDENLSDFRFSMIKNSAFELKHEEKSNEKVNLICRIVDPENRYLRYIKTILYYDEAEQQQKYSKDNGEVFFSDVPKNKAFRVVIENENYSGSYDGNTSQSYNDIVIKTLQKNIIVQPENISVKLKVSDESNNPLKDASVTLSVDNEIIESMVSNENGEVNFKELPKGKEVSLEIKSDNFQTYSLQCKIENLAGKVFLLKPIKTKVSSNEITFMIFDSRTKYALSNVLVTLMVSGRTFTVYSNSTGQARLENLPDRNNIQVEFYKENYNTVTKFYPIILQKQFEQIYLKTISSGRSMSYTFNSGQSRIISSGIFDADEFTKYSKGSLKNLKNRGLRITYNNEIKTLSSYQIGYFIGIGFNEYKAEFRMDSILNEYPDVDLDVFNHDTSHYLRRVYGREINERITLDYLSVPLGLYLKIPFKTKILNCIYLNVETNFNLSLSNTYTVSNGSFSYRGYYNIGGGIELTENSGLPIFYENKSVPSEKSNLHLKSSFIGYGCSGGFIFNITENTGLIIGGYYTGAITNVSNTTSESRILSINPDNYNGISNRSRTLKPGSYGVYFGFNFNL